MRTQNFSKSTYNKKSNRLNDNMDVNISKGFALEKINYILIAISFALVILGFALMGGESSTPDNYNADIFSWRRIVLGPTISFIGFVAIIFGIMYKKKGDK